MERKAKRGMAATVALLWLLAGAVGVFSAGQPEAAGAEGPMEITWLIRITSGEDTSWCIEHLEEELNVRIIPNGIGSRDREKVSVMLAAGEFPDFGHVYVDTPKVGTKSRIAGVAARKAKKTARICLFLAGERVLRKPIASVRKLATMRTENRAINRRPAAP